MMSRDVADTYIQLTPTCTVLAIQVETFFFLKVNYVRNNPEYIFGPSKQYTDLS